jgi:hypothetical protein
MLKTIDFDFVIHLLLVAHHIRRNLITFEACECDIDNAKRHKYSLIRSHNLANQFKLVEKLVEAYNNDHTVSGIDQLFYQLSDGVIRYTKGQICILTNPESTEPIDPETLI